MALCSRAGCIIYLQEFLFTHISEMADHLIENAILPKGFLGFQLSDGTAQLIDGEFRCHAGGWRLFLYLIPGLYSDVMLEVRDCFCT